MPCYGLQIHVQWSELQSWIMLHTNGLTANKSWTQPLSQPISVSTSCRAWNGLGLVSNGFYRQERLVREGSTLTSPSGNFCLGACSGASLSSSGPAVWFQLLIWSLPLGRLLCLTWGYLGPSQTDVGYSKLSSRSSCLHLLTVLGTWGT